MRATTNLLLRAELIAAFGLILVGRVTAQTFTKLHTFTALDTASFTNSDGGYPLAGLILSGNTLYGTARVGGSWGHGTVFAVNTDGTGFTNLHSFVRGTDGAGPDAALILVGNRLYGTASGGGNSDNGTVFKVNTDGTAFTRLYSFTASPATTNSDGANPEGNLILSGNTLYGTASYGGGFGNGTVFKINTDGTGFTNLHSFAARDDFYGTNSDGVAPLAGLVLSGNTLYGTTYLGGTAGDGTLFAVNTTGMGFTNLHNFTGGDGALLSAGLMLSGKTLYGTGYAGGDSGPGTVFAVDTNGAGFITVHSFAAGGYNAFGAFTNRDGSGPQAALILSGSTLYGTTSVGGSSGSGTVFKVNSDGSGFLTLYEFGACSGPYPCTNSDGANPSGQLVLSGNTLYGTTSGGGSSGFGTVFSLFIPPELAITASGTNVILTWPTNSAGFYLQSTANIGSASAWATNSSEPVVVNGRYVVTNPISSRQDFFRLSQ